MRRVSSAAGPLGQRTYTWLGKIIQKGSTVEAARVVPAALVDVDAKLASAIIDLCGTSQTPKGTDTLRTTITAAIMQLEDTGFDAMSRVTGAEMLWTVCSCYAVRGEKEQVFTITDLDKVKVMVKTCSFSPRTA